MERTAMRWTGATWVLLALGTAPARAQAPATWQLHSSVGFAYDSFGMSYTIADDDTLDLIDEMRGQVTLGIEHLGNPWFRVANTFSLGQEATRNDAQLGLRWRGPSLDLQILDDVHLKNWRTQSDYSLSSDYVTHSARLLATLWHGGPWRLRLRDRLENAYFSTRNRYNYDFLRNEVGGEVERRWGVLSSVRAGYRFDLRNVPDSTAIDYRSHRLVTGWTQEFGWHTLSFDQTLERRRYRDAETRSPFWDFQASLSVSAALGTSLRLRPAYRAILVNYDLPDSVYADASEHSFELLLEADLGPRTTLGVGPRTEIRRTQSLFDRPYEQVGVKGTLSYLLGPALWIQFTNELGRRTYGSGSELLLTDYFFNWSTLMLSARLPPGLLLDVFFSLEPEKHETADNDVTTLLLSAALTVPLR
jgi:hypothetical protein